MSALLLILKNMSQENQEMDLSKHTREMSNIKNVDKKKKRSFVELASKSKKWLRKMGKAIGEDWNRGDRIDIALREAKAIHISNFNCLGFYK